MDLQTTSAPSARRLNVRLILIGLLGLCALTAGVAELAWNMRARRERQTLEWAERAMKEGRYDDAATQFATAVARRPQDADLSLKAGDAFYALSASKPEALERARVAWQAAARLEPNNLPALHRLLQLQTDWAEVRPSAASFGALGEISLRVAAISPDDKDAAAARLIAQLGPWFSKNAPASFFEAGEHNALLESLRGSIRNDNFAGRLILYYALAVARRTSELEQADDSGLARQFLDQAEHDIEQAGGSDPQSLYRGAQGLTVLAEANRQIDQATVLPPSIAPTSQPTPQPSSATVKPIWPTWDLLGHTVQWEAEDSRRGAPEKLAPSSSQPATAAAERCFSEARLMAARAGTALGPSDVHLLDDRLLESHLALVTGDRRASEQICRQALSIHPGSLRAQTALAELISESDPQQAMAILDQPEQPSEAGPGPIALARRDLLIRASMQRARLHLDAAALADDPAVCQVNLSKASAACDGLAAMLVNDAESLKLTGRLRMLQGRYADALRLLDRSVVMRVRVPDLDSFSYRASSLLALHEAQAAIDNWHALLAMDPSRAADRLQFSQALIGEGRMTEAAKQVDELEKQLGGDERVQAIRVRLLAARVATDPGDTSLHEAYARLPEESGKQKLAKARLALIAGQPGDAVLLLQAAHGGDPSSVPVDIELARAQIAEGRAELAAAVIAQALGQHPTDAALLAAQKSLVAPVSPDAYEVSLQGPNVKDFLAAVHACRAALEIQGLPAAKSQIDVMTRLRPDEPLLFALKFRYDIAAAHWADAGSCVDHLVRANFDQMEGLSYLFQLHMARGQLPAATDIARQMTLTHPRQAAGWIDLAQALFSGGKYDRATESFQNALKLEPKSIDAIKGFASCLQTAGRVQEADSWVAAGRHLAPADDDFREMELDRKLGQGDPRRLIPAFESAIKKEPERPGNVVALARVYLRINRLETLSHPAEAHSAAAKAVELLNNAVKKWPDDRDCSFWAAHASAVSGDVASGMLILSRLCDRVAWATRPDALQMLADFCLTWGDPKSAEAAMRGAMARGAGGVEPARRLAAVLMRSGSWQPANELLQKFPSDAMAQQQRITIFVATGQGAAVEKELQRALALNPHDYRVMSLLGALYSIEQDVVQARLWLDRAIAAGDDEVAGRTRGALALREGRPNLAAAIQGLEIAWEANPSDGGAALFLSDAHIRNHDAARAQQVLETALKITPSDTELRLALVSMLSRATSPNWEQIGYLIDEGHRRGPSDWGWDAAEARMWLARHEPAKAAAIMRHAVQLAGAAPGVADAALESQDARQLRALIPNELWMLLAAGAHEAILAEADQLVSRYGPRDILSAWGHYARAAVQRRTGSADGGAGEYSSAIATAQAVGGYPAASGIVEAISSEAGADEAVARINAYLAAVDRARHQSSAPGPAHDPRWDLLRVDLLRRNNEIHAAAAQIDKLIPQLTSIPAANQVALLRVAVVIYLLDSNSQMDKALGACLELLRRQPDDPWALNNLATIYIERALPSESSKALDYSQRAYRSAERSGQVDPQIADTYGWALAVAGRGNEALELLKPIAGRLDIPDVQYHLAQAYLAAGAPLAAWPHLRTAVAMMQRDQREGRRIDTNLRRGVANTFWRAACQTALYAMQGGADSAATGQTRALDSMKRGDSTETN
jgi:tetratricopeptide (TPR) repeat protein